jgi:preprotein translocase subunit SecA
MLKNILSQKSIINKYKNLITQINLLENNFNKLTDTELRAKTFELKKKYNNEKNLDSILCESFALIRETSLRTLGLRHFDVQLIGGLTLHYGKIAEMRTGEGKTLVATAPAYLNSLTDQGVHIVTVNDYLANRDQISMGQIYRFLGVNTGLIQENMSTKERQKNYSSSITYVTNNELGFDYLRDNIALDLNEIVLRPLNYCIVDEVDSILIDEAQTPLILSTSVETSIDKYILAAEIAEYLEITVHFKVDEKNKNVILTEKGTIQIEKILGVTDLFNPNDPWIPYILNAIKASTLFFLNIHYIIQNNQVIIVDEFTGRIMPDRRWSDGLHQAIEAKERVPIRQNSQTIASITYQNFFLLYSKLSGMTGTAKTAELEFEKIYSLTVEEIPTARPNKRKDLPDLVYKDELLKWNAIAEECKAKLLIGQPILIGTTTVEKSETLAQLLQEYNLPYKLLNAKPENVRKESEIISQAGEKGSITIATNMAGRGTDIILGGNIEFKVKKQLYNLLVFFKNVPQKTHQNILFTLNNLKLILSQRSLSVLFSLLNDSNFLQLLDTEVLTILNNNSQLKSLKTNLECSVKFLVNQVSLFEKKLQKIDHIIVKNLGGLYVIGTERNDSRRIDNQLRGRAGRQGDPGLSRFFLSLDDKLLRLFGGTKFQNFMQNQLLDDLPLESTILTKSLDSAQKRVEESDYDNRKYLFDYDEILNKQRSIIYSDRRDIVNGNEQTLKAKILSHAEQYICAILIEVKQKKLSITDSIEKLENLFGITLELDFFYKFYRKGIQNKLNNALKTKFLGGFKDEETLLKEYLIAEFWSCYELKYQFSEYKDPNFRTSLHKKILLTYYDNCWKEQLQNMSLLRDAVGWRSYGQRNPLFEYKDDSYKLFKDLSKTIRQLVVYECISSEI